MRYASASRRYADDGDMLQKSAVAVGAAICYAVIADVIAFDDADYADDAIFAASIACLSPLRHCHIFADFFRFTIIFAAMPRLFFPCFATLH